MSAELALAIPPMVDLCLTYGKKMKALCQTIRLADREVSERVVRLDNGWLRFTLQLNFLRRIQHVMEDDHREVCEQTLRVLLGKLEIVNDMLSRLVKQQSYGSGPVSNASLGARKAKYTIKKESLDKAIEEFEIWQGIGDQSWFLLMRIADSQVDVALKTDDAEDGHTSTADAIPSTLAIRSGVRVPGIVPKSKPGLTLSADEVSKMKTWRIPYSDGFIAQAVSSQYILNHIQCQPLAKYNLIKQDARDLARKLQHKEPHTFGLLSCKGLATPSTMPPVTPGGPEPEVNFTMVFRMPPEASSPRSLRDLLANTDTPRSLSLRFDIAKQLAKSIGHVHNFGFVHKNVRPESILIFTGTNGLTQSVFLTGFENFRRDNGWTQRRGDDALDRNLYRHPSRQGVCPSEDYIMQHDIYSLGVCLLEIGFWKSFVGYHPQSGLAMATALLGIPAQVDSAQSSYFLHTRGKDHLLMLARSHLPQHMGSKYAEIVETCLTCLDPENADFGDASEFEDEDGIRVGVRYIDKVVLRLNRLYV